MWTGTLRGPSAATVRATLAAVGLLPNECSLTGKQRDAPDLSVLIAGRAINELAERALPPREGGLLSWEGSLWTLLGGGLPDSHRP